MVKCNTKEMDTMITNDRYTSRGLPAEVHTRPHVTPLTRRGTGMPPPRDKPSGKTVPLRIRVPVRLKTGVICLAAAAGLCAVLIPLWRRATPDSGGGLGGVLGEGLLQGGLPPTGGIGWETDGLAGVSGDTGVGESEEITPALQEDTRPAEPPESQQPPEDPSKDPSKDPSVGPSKDPSEDPPVTGDTRPDGATTEEGTDAVPDTDAEGPLTTEGEMPVETRPSAGGEHVEETVGTVETGEPGEPGETGESSAGGTEGEPDTAPELDVPAGCYPYAERDMSLSDYGAGYIEGDTSKLPAVLPDGRLWDTDGVPAVLIVHTHPYEGYSDGGDWYSPDGGGLALTDTPNAPDGVVSLGAELTRALRGAGITVIHLRIAVSAEDTAADIYERTRTVIGYYCRTYPDIGLILNLRRSAELTEDGEILRTAGSYGGGGCAQLRISVGGSGEGLAGDLTAALSLRARLWAVEPTLSRPVWVKAGDSIMAGDGARVLTLDMGSAGNTYDEALRLVAPLAKGLVSLLGEEN